jgi:hypothetical protein
VGGFGYTKPNIFEGKKKLKTKESSIFNANKFVTNVFISKRPLD